MKKDYLVFGIFGIIGIIFIIICFFVGKSQMEFDKVAVEITGTITEIERYRDSDGDTHHRVYVDYSYQGQEYEDVNLNSYSSTMYVGKEISLKIDPDNPRRVQTPDTGIVVCIILGGMGLIFALVGIIPIIVGIRKSNKHQALMNQGRYIYAIVETIDVNYSYSVNRRHPFLVYCYHQDPYSGVVYKFKSENLWTDPCHFLQPGSEIRVYVNGTDYSDYYVDVEGCMQGRVVDYT